MRQEIPPWFKTLKPNCAKVFSQDSDMVKGARREFFLKHSYNFTTDGNCNLSRTFRQLAASANLLGTSIHEIQASWTGPKDLKQVNYALQSLPKGLKFLHVVLPSESPKVMGLVGIHNPDALCHFGGITYCPWCRKEGQKKGTVVNDLQTMHYRLGLVCNRCYDSHPQCLTPSTTTAGMTVANSGKTFPLSWFHLSSQLHENPNSAEDPHKEEKTEWST